VSGLTFDFSWQIDSVDAGATLLNDHHRIIMPDLKSDQLLDIHIRYSR
jgi:hypothetical protein